MYPYQTKPVSIEAKSTESPSSLAQDTRLLDLLALVQAEAAALKVAYESRQKAASEDSLKEIFRSLSLDEAKHSSLLGEALYSITGKRPAVKEATEELGTQTSTLIQRELDNSSFYRDVFLALPQGELRDYLFEIFSDAQNHSLILMNIPKE